MRLNTSCAVLPSSRPEAVFGAVLEILLKARLDLRLDADGHLYEEDVNAYLGGVLVSYIDPRYLQEISEDLSRHDVDVYEAIDRAMPDRSRMYRIYKVNADDLLLSVGIFQPVPEPRAGLGRIKEYYACAAECQKRIYGKPTAVAEIQAKLSEGAERYLSVLAQTRKDYLHFIRQVSGEELGDFGKRIFGHP
jgi:hypothetical protein